jgi:hypothetical protein
VLACHRQPGHDGSHETEETPLRAGINRQLGCS